MRKAFFYLLTILFFILTSQFAFAVDKQVTLAWDHDGVDLTGFKIYWGLASGNYSNNVDVALATSCPAPDASEYCHTMTLDIPENASTEYFFAATAYDDGSNESEFSEEATNIWDFLAPPAVIDLAASYDKFSNILSFTWTYETAWLPKITKWSLWIGDASGGPYTEVVDIPYDPGTSPPYTTDVEIPVPPGETVTKYYVMITHRGADNNNALSVNSNEVSITIDKMPPKSPFEFKIKIR
jgi:hypothetical protein